MGLDLATPGRSNRARPPRDTEGDNDTPAGQFVREGHAQCQRPGEAQRSTVRAGGNTALNSSPLARCRRLYLVKPGNPEAALPLLNGRPTP